MREKSDKKYKTERKEHIVEQPLDSSNLEKKIESKT